MRYKRFRYGVLPLGITLLALSVTTPASAVPTPQNPIEDVQRAESTVTVGEETVFGDEFGVVAAVVEVSGGEPALLKSATLESSGDLPLLTTLATHKSVQLSWDEVSPATTYTLYRDDQLISTTTDEEFLDERIKKGAKYSYVVEAVTPADQAEIPSIPRGTPAPQEGLATPQQGPSEYDPSLVEPSQEEAPDYVVVMGSDVTIPAESGTKSAHRALENQIAARDYTTSSTIRHTSFIPDARAVSFPCVIFPTGTYFGGDNRGYSQLTDVRFRTRLTANIDWANNGFVTQIGETSNTNLYNSDGTVRETRNAGISGMNIGVIRSNLAYSNISATHSVGNPFCGAGAITYEWQAQIYRSGQYTILGTYRPAPNHEIYLRTGGTWKTIFQADNVGFECLTGVCGSAYIS